MSGVLHTPECERELAEWLSHPADSVEHRLAEYAIEHSDDETRDLLITMIDEDHGTSAAVWALDLWSLLARLHDCPFCRGEGNCPHCGGGHVDDRELLSYRVVFERIGRTRDAAPLVTQARDADELAEQIYRYARPHLLARDISIEVDLDRMAGAIFSGFRSGGNFTIEVEDGETVPEDPDAARDRAIADAGGAL